MDLTYRIEQEGSAERVLFSGPVDEDAEVILGTLHEKISSAAECIFNFKEVTTINSCGVRAWINFLRQTEAHAKVQFEDCLPEVISQINMIPSFKGSATIQSIHAGYVCEHCDTEALHCFTAGDNMPTSSSDDLEEVKCPNCGETMEMEELEEEFFAWLDAS